MSDPPPKKVGSLKDRLAMFENKGAASAPGPAPAPRPKPGNISWKPKAPSPPVSPRGGDGEGGAPTSPNPPTSPGSAAKKAGMSAADAKESIKLGGSLKDRMAALQGKSAFGGLSTGPPPPKPASEKPKWKPPPAVAVAPAIGDDEPTGDAPKPPVIPTPAKEKTEDEAIFTELKEGNTTAVVDSVEESSDRPSEEDEERERRAAIAARMARLGGARVGMGPPPILGKKPEIKRSTPSTTDVPTSTTEPAAEPASVQAAPLQEPIASAETTPQAGTTEEVSSAAAETPSVPEIQTTHDDISSEKSSISQVQSSTSIHDSNMSPADNEASSKSLAPTSVPLPVPLPALPRRAAPPRRRAKSPMPETRASETQAASSTSAPADAVAESIPVEPPQVEAEAVAPPKDDDHRVDIPNSEASVAEEKNSTSVANASVAESIPLEVSQVKAEVTEESHIAASDNEGTATTAPIEEQLQEERVTATDLAPVAQSLDELEPAVASQVAIDNDHDLPSSTTASEVVDQAISKPSTGVSDLDDFSEPHLSSSVVQVPEPLPAGGDPRDFAPQLFEHAPDIKPETQSDFVAQQTVPPTIIPGLTLRSDKEAEPEEVHPVNEAQAPSAAPVQPEEDPEGEEEEEAARHARIAARMAKMGGVNPFAATRSPPSLPPSRKASEQQPGIDVDSQYKDHEVLAEEPISAGSEGPATQPEDAEDSKPTHVAAKVASPGAGEDEDENARKARIATRLAKMGGVNPFGAPKPPSRQATQSEEPHEEAKPSAEAEDSQSKVRENQSYVLAHQDSFNAHDNDTAPQPPPRRNVQVVQPSVTQDEEIAEVEQVEDEAPPPPPARVAQPPRIASEHTVRTEKDAHAEPEDHAPLPPPPRFAPLRYQPPPAAADEEIWEQDDGDEEDEPQQIHRSLSDVVSAIKQSGAKAEDDDELPPHLPAGRHGSVSQPSHEDEEEQEQDEEKREEAEYQEEVYAEEEEERPAYHRQFSDIVDAVQQHSHEVEEQDNEAPPPLPAGRHGSVPVTSTLIHEEPEQREEESVPPPLPSGRRPSGISVLSPPPTMDYSSDHEILDDEEGDPIDPRFHSPRSSTAPQFPPIAAPSPPPPARVSITSPPITAPPPPTNLPEAANEDENEDEEAEKARRRTIAERMAKLGGVRFGAPPPAPRAVVSHHDEVPREEQQQPTEEEDEAARKERIRAKLAGMGGQRFGMFAPPPSVKMAEDERPTAAQVEEEAPPPPPSRPSRPPPPPQELVEEPSEKEEEVGELQDVEEEEEAPPVLPPSRRPPVPGPPKPPSRQTTTDLSQSIEIIEPEYTSPKPPSRSIPNPPPPPQRLESQWELPEIPTSGGGLMPTTGDDSPTRWSEDSTSYPPAPPMKPTVSQAAPPPPSVADLNLSADDLMGIWGKVGVHVHHVAMEMQEKSKKSIIGDGSYAGFMSAVLAEVPNALPPSGQPLSYGYIVYAQQGGTVQRRVADVMPGDVMVLYDAKLKGHKGLQTYNQHVGVEEPCVGVVSEVEPKKFKVRMVHANQHVSQQGVESASYRLEDLKSGQVKIFRVLEKVG